MFRIVLVALVAIWVGFGNGAKAAENDATLMKIKVTQKNHGKTNEVIEIEAEYSGTPSKANRTKLREFAYTIANWASGVAFGLSAEPKVNEKKATMQISPGLLAAPGGPVESTGLKLVKFVEITVTEDQIIFLTSGKVGKEDLELAVQLGKQLGYVGELKEGDKAIRIAKK